MHKTNCYRKLNVSLKLNAQSTILKRRLNDDHLKLKNSIFDENFGAHFTFKISTNQRFGTYATSEAEQSSLTLDSN